MRRAVCGNCGHTMVQYSPAMACTFHYGTSRCQNHLGTTLFCRNCVRDSPNFTPPVDWPLEDHQAYLACQVPLLSDSWLVRVAAYRSAHCYERPGVQNSAVSWGALGYTDPAPWRAQYGLEAQVWFSEVDLVYSQLHYEMSRYFFSPPREGLATPAWPPHDTLVPCVNLSYNDWWDVE